MKSFSEVNEDKINYKELINSPLTESKHNFLRVSGQTLGVFFIPAF